MQPKITIVLAIIALLAAGTALYFSQTTPSAQPANPEKALFAGERDLGRKLCGATSAGACAMGICGEGYVCTSFTDHGKPTYCGCIKDDASSCADCAPSTGCSGRCGSSEEICTVKEYWTTGDPRDPVCYCAEVQEDPCSLSLVAEGGSCGGTCEPGFKCSFLSHYGTPSCKCIRDSAQQCGSMSTANCSVGSCPAGKACKSQGFQCGCVLKEIGPSGPVSLAPKE